MEEKSCCFFGHKDAYGLDREWLLRTIRKRIQKGDYIFYVGNQGAFDRMVYKCLKQLEKEYTYIQVYIVLAYLPTEMDTEIPDSIYPEIEGHPKFAIDRRNRWMIDASNTCICYVNHTWGGAYKFAKLAKGRELAIINLGSANI